MAFYADSEAIDVSSADWTPTAPRTNTTAIQCLTAGTLMVDYLGVQPGQPGKTNQPLQMAANQIIGAGIIKAHHTASTGTYRAFY